MIDHIGISVNDLEKSKVFYSRVLGILGHQLLVDFKDWNAAGFGSDRPRFWLELRKSNVSEAGIHICFMAKNRKEVDDFYSVAIAEGARDNGMPGLRPKYHENYYGAFVFDFDGNNIEACCHQPE